MGESFDGMSIADKAPSITTVIPSKMMNVVYLSDLSH